jgi:hypothetical protein
MNNDKIGSRDQSHTHSNIVGKHRVVGQNVMGRPDKSQSEELAAS